MQLIQLLVILVIFGFALWVINSVIPMGGTVRRILTGVTVLILVLVVLSSFGLLGRLPWIRIG
jgi:hypothetical protein